MDEAEQEAWEPQSKQPKKAAAAENADAKGAEETEAGGADDNIEADSKEAE